MRNRQSYVAIAESTRRHQSFFAYFAVTLLAVDSSLLSKRGFTTGRHTAAAFRIDSWEAVSHRLRQLSVQ